LLLLSLGVPVVTLMPALAWGSPLLDLAGMVRYHGLVNAIGHAGLGLVAFGMWLERHRVSVERRSNLSH
jgi:hypothetical protein